MDLWHDRAVFHFLTEERDQLRYVELVEETVVADGHVVLATFGPHAPTRCSGLPVARYDAGALAGRFARGFTLARSRTTVHRTPGGAEQELVFVLLRRLSAG